MLDALRDYWKIRRPNNYLFPGRTPEVPLSSPTIQKACRLSAALAGIKNIVTPHTLRHSYATSMLEAGVDLLTISKLLGHSSFVTTMIYLHVRRQHFDRSPSPIDWPSGAAVSPVGRAVAGDQRDKHWGHLSGTTDGREHFADGQTASGGSGTIAAASGSSAAAEAPATHFGTTAASETKSPPRVIDLIRQFAPRFLTGPGNIAFQVKSVLSKLLLCRTKTLGGHTYVCPPCGSSCQVYNSCGDRHCPLCAGARRADWMEKTRELILPGVNYFQVIFTLPDRLSRLILANRRAMYTLLFRSAWLALRHEMRKQGIEPAAVLVLHTWNQELGHHPHIHALVPGAGPSANPDNDPCWVVAQDASFPNRREPFLVDVEQLGRTFRDRFAAGLGTLLRKGSLRLHDEWSQLHDTRVRRDWLKALRQSNWNVFISGPPNGRSDPEQVLKYMTRYLTGGPISDARIVGQSQDQVTFLARSKDKSQGNPQVEHTTPGVEFLRRWSLHILPKGFTRCRRYGGYHGSRCARYLETCRELLRVRAADQEAQEQSQEMTDADNSPPCPRCQKPMVLLECTLRPSWRDVFQGSATHPRLVNFPWLRPGPQTRQHPFEPDG